MAATDDWEIGIKGFGSGHSPRPVATAEQNSAKRTDESDHRPSVLVVDQTRIDPDKRGCVE